jgi:hypothetical protein
MVQVVSVLGALVILVAYSANQFRLIGPSNLSYTLLNLLGAGVLTVIAVITPVGVLVARRGVDPGEFLRPSEARKGR